MERRVRMTARFAILSIAIGTAGGCSRSDRRPNVIVILVDALRADHVGCYGYSRDTTPNIDALAANSVVFRTAYSQSPWTKPSIPTLFTSLYPIQHGVYEGETAGDAGASESDVLDDEVTTVAEAFRGAGYLTVALVNNAHLHGGHGFAQGFESYLQADMDAPEINRRFLEFTDSGRDRPFFAYLHYLDVHWPYRPDPPFDTRFEAPPSRLPLATKEDWRGLRDRINDGVIELSPEDRARFVSMHDGAVAQFDARIGELLDALRRRGVLDGTVILLTSDHGEELFDHGKVGHGGTVFEEVLRIPMILRLPNGPRGVVVDAPARTIDVFPTLLHAADLSIPRGLEGRSLVPGGTPRGVEELIAETRHKRTYRVAVRSGSWKLVRTYRTADAVSRGSSAAPASPFVVGMRLKVKGRFLEDGTFAAERVSVKDAGDTDSEVSAVVSHCDPTNRRFRLNVFTVVPDPGLPEGSGAVRMTDLRNGNWVKAEGKLPDAGTTLVADRIELLPKDQTDTEIEGLLQAVERVSDSRFRGRMLNIPVLFDDRTKVRGADAAPTSGTNAASVEDETNRVDRFSPARLRSGEGLSVEESVFDLARDPDELHDVAVREVERTTELRGQLFLWLDRMASTSRAPRGPRQRLDAAEIERLRALGYGR